MTTKRITLLCVAICTISACFPNSNKKKETYSFERVHYELKEGVDESELQGAPWINSNLPDMTAKVEKPSLRDDFYASVNYEQLVNNEPGPFDISTYNVSDQLRTLLNDETEATNSALLRKAYSLINAGAASQILTYLSNIDLTNYLNSKNLFLHNTFFSITPIGDGEYQLTFNDGYIEGSYSFVTLMFYGGYYDKYLQIENRLKEHLFDAFNFTISDDDYADLKEVETTFTYSKYSYYQRYGYKNEAYQINGTGSYNFLDNTLRDAGFNNGDTFAISNVSSDSLHLFDYYCNNYPAAVKNALKCRLMFEFRFLAGLEKYKPISKDLADSGFFYDDDLTNIDNERGARALLRQSMSALLEKAYIELYADANVKNQVSEIIEQVLTAYSNLANDLDWIDVKTKKGLLRKLNAMRSISCYSDKIKNYPSISETGIESFTLFDIFSKYRDLLFDLTLSSEIEQEYFWQYMPSYTVNAFYSPTTNSFVILNGLLSGGFIGETIEETLGGVGFVIGHEISHSIDESGSQFDEKGQQTNWWSTRSKKEFKSRIAKMKDFYNQINLFDDVYVNGENVNTEATADMGGMHVCLEIAKTIPNFDYDKFFKAYAKTWLSEAFDYATVLKYLNDSHPFDYLRCNVTLAQFDEFIETYDIQKGDGMYIPKSERVAIW